MTDTTTATFTRVADLQVGDTVILTGDRWTDRIGQERTIRRIDHEGEDYAQARFEEGGYADDDQWTVTKKEDYVAPTEVTLEEAIASGAYHPDLLPMMEKISAAADSAGYCAEYDRMARSVGAPTRAEVRRIVRERDGSRKRITFPVTVNITFETEGRVTDDEAIRELGSKMSTWESIVSLVSESIRTNRWDALPTGGTIPETRTIVSIDD